MLNTFWGELPEAAFLAVLIIGILPLPLASLSSLVVGQDDRGKNVRGDPDVAVPRLYATSYVMREQAKAGII
jgi:hypothetical protein